MSTLKKNSFIVLMLLLSLVVTACGSGSKETAEAENTANAAEETETKASGYPKEVKHLKGTTLIPAKPEKIVTSFVGADFLFELNKAPYGVSGLEVLGGFKVFEDELKKYKIEDMGNPLNYEKVLAAKPDLIIAFDWDQVDYDKLSKIAPTVIVDGSSEELNPDGFIHTFTQIADMIGENEAKDAFVKRYEERKAEAKKNVEAAGLTGKTALFMMAGEKINYVYSGSSTKIYLDAGLKAAPGTDKDGQIDLEGLSKVNPDVIFLAEDYSNRTGAVEKIQQSDIWKNLKAVKENHVYIWDTAALGPMAQGKYYGIEYLGKEVK
ncbi:ABC transporter substrate-binding protein [Paenibacillus gansuensis]|uniref:ABC transporter substrate-binding protein n=1 Tax=Paenibacillus gansuensis TaxID=306542 RepID=A0ABW5P872_9BACL